MQAVSRHRVSAEYGLGSKGRPFRFVLAAALAVIATGLADVLAPTGVLVAIAVLAMVGVTAAYLVGGP